MHNIAPMTEDQEAIREAVAAVCAQFTPEYWRKCDETGAWPEEFTKAMAEGGWLGIAMPEEVGGSGLGLMEASIMMQAVARSGAGFTGCSSIHLNIFGAKPIEKFGTSEQKQEFLPKIISGQQKMCFGVTEPNSGLDTSSLQTRAERTNSGYVINGRKIWTTGASAPTRSFSSRAPRRRTRSQSPIWACRCSTWT
jgi:acyl-CoA dehydrogenase